MEMRWPKIATLWRDGNKPVISYCDHTYYVRFVGVVEQGRGPNIEAALDALEKRLP